MEVAWGEYPGNRLGPPPSGMPGETEEEAAIAARAQGQNRLGAHGSLKERNIITLKLSH